MKKAKNLSLSICALALILSGCGGGGGGSSNTMMPTDTGMTGGTDTGMTGGTDTGMTGGTDTGMTGGTDTGMTGGTDTGMNGGNGMEPPVHTPTLAEIYSSDTAPHQPFSVVSSSVIRNNTSDTSSLPADMELSVSSVRRNTGGGYDITYRVDGRGENVRFLPEHCDEVEQYCVIPGHVLWTMLTPVPGGGQLALTTEWDYFSVAHLNTNVTTSDGSSIHQRQMFVFGVETPTAAVPTQGEAVYEGWLRADALRQDSPSFDRQRYSGSMQIVANFDMGSLNGRVFSVRGSQLSMFSFSDWEYWRTSSFSITNGRISDGQFTARLTGLDSDPDVPFNESVRGFMGEIVGKFFGPNAEELGGSVSASRDGTGTDDDLILYGYIAAGQLGPAKTLGSAGLLAGSRSDLTADTSVLQEDDGMATVERTANGWRVSVGGRTVEFRDNLDYGTDSQFPSVYLRSVSDGIAEFWTFTDGFGKTTPEFNHFDVKGWGFGEYDSQNHGITSTYTHIVHGDRTPRFLMPTSGTATYSGRMKAVAVSTDKAIFSNSHFGNHYVGDVTLTADFANSGVKGEFTKLLQSRIAVGGPYVQVHGGVAFNAAINGNGITADDLSGSIGALIGYQNGNVRGSFFGPFAEEAAGVFDAHDRTGNQILSGWFGTTKDE